MFPRKGKWWAGALCVGGQPAKFPSERGFGGYRTGVSVVTCEELESLGEGDCVLCDLRCRAVSWLLVC